MQDEYGSDFLTIEDEDGTQYELEILTTLEYNGCSYLAVIPADSQGDYEVMILKSVDEDGESILCASKFNYKFIKNNHRSVEPF